MTRRLLGEDLVRETKYFHRYKCLPERSHTNPFIVPLPEPIQLAHEAVLQEVLKVWLLIYLLADKDLVTITDHALLVQEQDGIDSIVNEVAQIHACESVAMDQLVNLNKFSVQILSLQIRK